MILPSTFKDFFGRGRYMLTALLLLLLPSALNAMENSIFKADANDVYEVKVNLSFSNSSITTPQTICAHYDCNGKPLGNEPLSISTAFKPGSSANVELYCVHLPNKIVLSTTITDQSKKPWPLSSLFPDQWKWTSQLSHGEQDTLTVSSDPKIVMTMAAYIEKKKKQ